MRAAADPAHPGRRGLAGLVDGIGGVGEDAEGLAAAGPEADRARVDAEDALGRLGRQEHVRLDDDRRRAGALHLALQLRQE